MLNVGWHLVFLLIWFFGEPKSMSTNKVKTDRKSFEYNTDDTVFIDLEYESFFGKAYMSVADSSKRDIFRIIGDKGTMEVNKKKCVVFDVNGDIIAKEDGNELLSYMTQLSSVLSDDFSRRNELKLINKITSKMIEES